MLGLGGPCPAAAPPQKLRAKDSCRLGWLLPQSPAPAAAEADSVLVHRRRQVEARLARTARAGMHVVELETDKVTVSASPRQPTPFRTAPRAVVIEQRATERARRWRPRPQPSSSTEAKPSMVLVTRSAASDNSLTGNEHSSAAGGVDSGACFAASSKQGHRRPAFVDTDRTTYWL